MCIWWGIYKIKYKAELIDLSHLFGEMYPVAPLNGNAFIRISYQVNNQVDKSIAIRARSDRSGKLGEKKGRCSSQHWRQASPFIKPACNKKKVKARRVWGELEIILSINIVQLLFLWVTTTTASSHKYSVRYLFVYISIFCWKSISIYAYQLVSGSEWLVGLGPLPALWFDAIHLPGALPSIGCGTLISDHHPYNWDHHIE